MQRRQRATIPLLVSALVAAACGGGTEVAEPEAPAADVAAVVDGNTAFTLDLFRTLAVDGVTEGDREGNLTLGPHSIATVLQMLEAGAGGGTAAEFAALFHRAPAGAELHTAAGALDVALRDRADDTTQLRIANAAFVQEGLALQPTYEDVITTGFAAEVRDVDFRADPAGASDAVNGWVDDATDGNIPKLLQPNDITVQTRLVAANAMYLEAEWVNGFERDRTRNQRFALLDGTEADVPMMCRSDAEISYAFAENYEAGALRYKGDALRMIVVVPHELPTFIEALDAADLAGIRSSLADQDMDVCLPRFEQRNNLKLDGALQSLGLTTAYTEGVADFSGITTDEELLLSFVRHEAWVLVDETGTKAAAATGGGAVAVSAPPSFRVDRPFIFIIEDEPTQEILFIGMVLEPVDVSS